MLEKRPSKKQHEVLAYIDEFIKQHGFGPSYREIMRALNLKSVSTVATHVDGLIARGLLVKREHSARSLQVLSLGEGAPVETLAEETHLAWLRREIAKREADESLLNESALLKDALALLERASLHKTENRVQ